jgi:hypothetical protein
MVNENEDSVIRTISISKADDDFLRNNKKGINFSAECRKLIEDLKKKTEGTTA